MIIPTPTEGSIFNHSKILGKQFVFCHTQYSNLYKMTPSELKQLVKSHPEYNIIMISNPTNYAG